MSLPRPRPQNTHPETLCCLQTACFHSCRAEMRRQESVSLMRMCTLHIWPSISGGWHLLYVVTSCTSFVASNPKNKKATLSCDMVDLQTQKHTHLLSSAITLSLISVNSALSVGSATRRHLKARLFASALLRVDQLVASLTEITSRTSCRTKKDKRRFRGQDKKTKIAKRFATRALSVE